MKRVLMLASVASMIDQFNMHNIELLQEIGFVVDVACNFEKGSTCSKERIEDLKRRLDDMGVVYYQVDFTRSVMNLRQDYVAYKQVKQMLFENKYEFIHCHSPIGGVIGRLAGHVSKTKVIYTAHGFHFFKGASIKNWIIYYPIERICSHWTDILITINKEDYAFALKKMKAKKVKYVPGVGIETKKYKDVVIDRSLKRSELGIPNNAILFISVGEVNKNKNHETVIRALQSINDKNIYYIIAGQGAKGEYLEDLINELGLKERIKLLGYRSDIIELYKMSDICVFPSYREGLSVALMEAMAAGLPVVCSNIRGNVDLIDHNGGCLFDPYSIESCAKALKNITIRDLSFLSIYNIETVKNFDVDTVKKCMYDIYLKELYN